MNTYEKDKQFIANTYSRFPVEIVKGKGSLCWDANGKEYIDFGSGIAVNSMGFCDDEWVEAVTKQLNTFQHTSNLYFQSPCIKLAEELCKRTGMKKIFFSNSGAEANECAIKTARKWAEENKGSDCYKIITLKNSFHGRTITTLAATGQDVFHKDFLPLTDGFLYAEANDINSVKEIVEKEKIAAIMFEAVQGEGGIVSLDKDFVLGLKQIADEYNILLIADEVQIGNGRSGMLYGYMTFGIQPDIVTTAKGLAGGLPFGATMFGKKTADVLKAGMHGSTFGGNPVCAAGAVNILSRIDDKLLSEVKEKSEFIKKQLEGAKGIKSVSGMGLMLGVETEKDAKQIVNKCIEKGVLFLTAKTKVRLLPALNIPMDLLKKAIDILKEVCAEEI